ncbi:hypothetical protein [Pseudoduganella sp. RAF53_2]|uniref:hypothetical protein n=1 Tax=unclassified Pseudoduganella TaxID=2637179 RepID=UPI003F9B2EE5
MNDKNAKDARWVLRYKSDAASRRAKSSDELKTADSSAAPVKTTGRTVVVRFEKDAKPVSELGGVSKVFGQSRIRIPEYKLHRR